MRDEKETVDKLRGQVKQYQRMLHNLHEGYILVDEDANIHDVNPAYCNMVGYSREELLSMKLTVVRPGMSLAYQKEFIKGIIKKGSKEFETQHRRKDGKIIDLNAGTATIKKDGEIYLAVFVRDVTGKKKVRERVEQSEQLFKSLFKYNQHPVYYFDLEGNFKEVNQKLVEFTGYKRDELLQLGFEHFIDEEDLERTKKHFQRAMEGFSDTYEISVWVQDGIKKEIRVTKFPIYVNEEIVGVYGILQDVTEQNRITRELKESEERWHRLVEENPKPVQITINGDIVFINEAGVKLYEAGSAEELIGRSVFDFVHPEEEGLKKRKNKLEKDMLVDQIHVNRIITCAGNERFVEVHSVSITYKGEKAVQTNIYDITDRKKEEAIIRSSLKEKQILLQEIHHRVKNNMAVISGLLELQAMNTENESLKNILKESQMRIYSMAMIHEKLYASKSLAAIKFDEYARELVEVIMSTMGDVNTEVTVRFRMDTGELNINQAIPCGLIFNELVVNCYKHAFAKQKAGSILVGFSKDGDRITISVEDNGKGMPSDFKIEQQQSLGMTIIQTLTKQLEGNIDIRSGQDQAGTCFVITFKEDQ